MSTIQGALTDGLRPIIASIPNLTSSSSSSKGKAKSSANDISAVWARLDLPQIAAPPPPLPKDASAEAKAARREEDRIRERPVDMIRGVLEVVGKDIVLGPLLSGELVDPPRDATESVKVQFQTQLQARLDVVLALYEAAGASYPDIPSLDAGYNFVPLLEELVELLSIDTWRELWSYVETRAPRYTKGMLPSRGKALSLLRILNTFTRFLPRTPEDIAFKGRVWQFASRKIGITDRSAVNFRGEFNHYKTTWEEEPSAPATEADGDVKMDDEKAEAQKDGIDSELYSTLWSLQEYFAFPPLLAQKTKQRRPFDHLEHFKSKTDAVLPKLFAETDRERDALAKEKEDGHERKRKRGDDGTGGFFHPRYLTERRLFEYELKDPSFRRQILTQYFILFQFLLNLTSESKGKQAYTGGMPKDFELKEEDIRWIKDKIKAIRGDLVKMPDDGPRFDNILLSIIGHEHFYAAWKNEACAEAFFEVPQAEQPEVERKIYTLPEQRLQPLNVKYYQPGSKPMPIPVTAVTIEEQGEDDDDFDLPEWQRMTKRMRKLQEDMADDEAMGQLEAAKKKAYEEKIEDLNYRAMRLARRVVDWRHFEANVDKSSVLALEDTVKAAETADTPVLTTTDRFQDEAVLWLPAPPEEAEPAETTMDVDEQAKQEEGDAEVAQPPAADEVEGAEVEEGVEVKEGAEVKAESAEAEVVEEEAQAVEGEATEGGVEDEQEQGGEGERGESEGEGEDEQEQGGEGEGGKGEGETGDAKPAGEDAEEAAEGVTSGQGTPAAGEAEDQTATEVAADTPKARSEVDEGSAPPDEDAEGEVQASEKGE